MTTTDPPTNRALSLPKRLLLSGAACYARRAPGEFGKFPLLDLALRVAGASSLEITSRDGLRFDLHFPEDHGWEPLVVRRTFEAGTTDLIRRLLRPTDVSVDIGANIGWYTVVMARATPRGCCHAFEPSPRVFERLEHHANLNRVRPRVVLNQLALGAEKGDGKLFSFSALGTGHASLSSLGRSDYSVTSTRIGTLDAYVSERALEQVDLVKMDVEGAEMAVLRGATALVSSPTSPFLVLEMNDETARAFGYSPADLLRFLENLQRFRFYRIVSGWGGVHGMNSATDYQHGDNVLCVPAGRQAHFESRADPTRRDKTLPAAFP